jgi:excisionase family DNA binding protein
MAGEAAGDLSEKKIAFARRGADKLRPIVKEARGRSVSVTIETKSIRIVLDANVLASMLELLDSVLASHSAEGVELTPNEAAEILRMSRPSVMRLVERGDLTARMVGSHHRLSRAEVLAYRDRQARVRRQALGNLARLTDEHDF